MQVRRKSTKKRIKPDIPLSESIFRRLSLYMLSEYKNRSFLSKLLVFYEKVNTNLYSEEAELSDYFLFTSRFAEIYVEDGITDIEAIYERLTESPKNADIIEELMEALTDELEEGTFDGVQASNVENDIIDRLNFINIAKHVNRIKKHVSRFEAGDYESYAEIVAEMGVACKNYSREVVSRATTSLTIPDLDTQNLTQFSNSLGRVRDFMNDPKRVVKTGIKRLNKMINGGFQPGRVYYFCAISGGWKSGLLLNTALWAMKYNPNIRCFDSTKQPCVVYISQENDNQETMERMISYVDGVGEDGKAEDTDSLLERFRNETIIDGRWILKIIYKPINSITTGDLEGIINEVELELNCEVKMLVHDYIKRIKPSNALGDIRLDIGEATNELSALAKQRKIPIVDANQLNREAYRTLSGNDGKQKKNQEQEGRGGKKTDLGRNLDQSMISESNMLIENADVVVAVNREYDYQGVNAFLTFKDLKNRSAKGNNSPMNTYFAHPFDGLNSMRLVEDLDLPESASFNNVIDAFGGDSDYEEDDEYDSGGSTQGIDEEERSSTKRNNGNVSKKRGDNFKNKFVKTKQDFNKKGSRKSFVEEIDEDD